MAKKPGCQRVAGRGPAEQREGKEMKICKWLLLSVAAFLCLSVSSFAAVPEKINYQGKLKESGSLVTASKNMLFKIYDASSAGNLLWQSGNPAGTAVSVSITNGLFTYVLGGSNDANDLSAIDWENKTCYLEVKVEATTLSPREQLISVPSALSVRGLDIDANGNVGIGTTGPGAKLQVAGGQTILEQQAWQTPTLLNGWVDYGSGFNPAGYFIIWNFNNIN